MANAQVERSRHGLAQALGPSAAAGIDQALHAVRTHLGMDVGFVSEFLEDTRLIRNVDAAQPAPPIRIGQEIPLDVGYCRKVIEGLLPELIPDTSLVPEALAIPETYGTPIGAHLSVPLRLRDGRLFGTFCCFSFKADPTLGSRDLDTMRAIADLVAYQIDHALQGQHAREAATQRIRALLASPDPAMVFQPVVGLTDLRIVGAEALARFKTEPVQSPDRWFAEAERAGLGVELEIKAIRAALADYRSAWACGPCHLGLNASPETIVAGDLSRVLDGHPCDWIILEITEHDHVSDYTALLKALVPLRARGVRIAVDDAGSGYASMRHILNVAPDFIKLDISLTRDIDHDRKRRALAGALIEFGNQTGCGIVAEGVETHGEMETLRAIGALAAQGYHFSRPVPIGSYLDLLRSRGVTGGA